MSAGEPSTVETPRLPAGSYDCHVHIYGPYDRFPGSEAGQHTSAAAKPVEDLLALWDRLGIAKGVIVHARGAGADNAVTYDALLRHPDRLRAIGLVDPAITDKRLDELTEAGFRGVRINLLRLGGKKYAEGGMTLEDLEALADRIGERGWHAQLWVAAADLAELAPRIEKLPLDFVIDHMGRTPANEGADNPGTRELCEKLKTGRYWTKISGADRNSQIGAPFTDTEPFMRALVEANPDRVVWGTDWPHVGDHVPPREEDLIDLLLRVVTDEATLHKILVENPKVLYGF